jgi:hypothetical protein
VGGEDELPRRFSSRILGTTPPGNEAVVEMLQISIAPGEGSYDTGQLEAIDSRDLTL